MTPNRWQQIEQIFQSALEMDSKERAVFLAKACADDQSLQSEVESLIAAHDQAGSFIASAPSASDQTILIEGREVGHYRILSLLGRGGMGEVYLAQDTRLGRKVALKLLPSGLTKDDDRVRRFQREARAASALNHPNIITVFDIGQSDDLHFIAAEFIDGPTLRALIGKEELSRLLELLAQVADGLAKAHSSGIIHRDLKPENIMATKDGFAKVLDFGLAKLVESAMDDNRSEAATSPVEQTRPGILIGTVGYMSPEQAQGRVVDHRSDIFSFGCILYEAVTARRPFEGDSIIEVLHRIVYEQPPQASDFNSNCPTELQRIIRKCLVKDPERRYQSIKDTAIDLREVIEECQEELSSSGSRRATEQAITKETVRDTTAAEPLLSDDDPRVRQMTRFSRSGVALALLALLGSIAIWPAYRKAEAGSELKLECPRVVALSKAREVAASLGYDATRLKGHAYFEGTNQVLRLVAAGEGIQEARRFVREGRAAVWNLTFARPDKDVFLGHPGNLDAGEFTVSISSRGQLISFSAAPASDDADAPPEQAQATSIAAETIQRVLSVDLSGYELESFSKSDSSRTIEIVWKNRSLTFGLVEIVRVFLKGTKITAINHSLRPPSAELRSGASRSSSLDRYQGMVVVMIFLAFYALGVIFLVKGKRWNALARRLPIIACILEASWFIAGGIIAFRYEGTADMLLFAVTLILLMVMAFFPGYAGLFELLRGWNPLRLYGAKEMARGRFFSKAAAVSLVYGILGGIGAAALGSISKLFEAMLPGYQPSISRVAGYIGAGEMFSSWGALELIWPILIAAIAVELMEKATRRQVLAAIIPALMIAFFKMDVQQSGVLIVASGVVIDFMIYVLIIQLYRSRGIAAAWLAAVVNGLINSAVIARYIADPAFDLQSSLIIMVVLLLLATGIWGYVREPVKTRLAAIWAR